MTNAFLKKIPSNKYKAKSSHGVNYLPNEYVIKSKSKDVQAILTQGNKVKDLPKIGN